MPIKNVNQGRNIKNEFEVENLKKFLEENKKILERNEEKINERKKVFTGNNNLNKGDNDFFENYNVYDQNFDFENEIEEEELEKFDEEEDKPDLKEEKRKDTEISNEENNYAEEVVLNMKKYDANISDERPSVRDLYVKNLNQKSKNVENPLLIYRDPGISIKLPSLGKFYSEGEVTLESNGEINILPMTIKDEIYLRSPDYLLNGSSIEKIIQSCVPSVKNPRKLLTNDVIALLLGIKWASGSNILSYSSNCPNCNTINNFDVDISYLFDNMTFLKDSYYVDLNNILVFVKPFDYDTVVKNATITFEESKILQFLMENKEMTDEEKLEKANLSLKRLQEMTFYSVLNSIDKVLIKDRNILVRDKNMISEWLNTIKIKDFNKIRDLIVKINEIGLPNHVEVTCRSCKFKYNLELKYDPSDFLE